MIDTFISKEALMRRKIVDQAKESILVADNSKFGHDVFAHVCPITAINLIITDSKLDPALITKFEAANLNLVLA